MSTRTHAPRLTGCLAAGVLALAAPIAAPAQNAPDGPENPFAGLTIEELLSLDITSVSKKPERLLDTPAAVTVITPDDIRRSGHTNLAELLRLAPGLSVARIDSSTWAITSRGFASQYANALLVMVDGRSVYNPIFSGVFWDQQDVFLPDVERVEIVRGPGGTMWGANAVNGVINVISKSAKETQGSLVQALGGTETWGGAARIGGVLGENAWYRVYGQYQGHDNTVDPSGTGRHDGWNHTRAGFRADWEATSRDTLTMTAEYGSGRADELVFRPSLSPPGTPLIETARDLGSGFVLGRWTHDATDGLDWTAQLYYDHTRRDSPEVWGAIVNTVDLSLEGRLRPLAGHDLVFGTGYRTIQDEIDNTFLVSADPERRRTGVASAFLQDTVTLVPERLQLIAGSKFEYNSYTGFEFQPSGRLVWTPDDMQTSWAAVSRAVRTPSRFESDIPQNYAVIPGIPTVLRNFANDDLDAVDLLAVEAGYRVKPAETLFVDTALFYNAYEDVIVNESLGTFPPPPALVIATGYANAMHGTTFGGEIAATWNPLEAWRLSGSYSHLHMNLRADANARNQEEIRGDSPVNQFQIRSGVDLPYDLEADAALYYVDELRGQDEVDAYVRLDLRLAWRPLEGLEASIVGQNLLEAKHAEYVGVTSPPAEIQRSVYASLSWRF